MLASSSRNALKRAQHKIWHAAVDAYAVGQRRYASASQLAVDPTEYASPNFIAPSNVLKKPSFLRHVDNNLSGTARTPVARYNMLLANHLDHGRTRAALGIVQRMKDEGIKPDVTTYNRILDACAREVLYPEARAVLEDMLAVGVEPNRQTFHSLMKSLSSMELHDIPDILKTMERWSIRPNEITYEIIITRFTEAQRLELALEYLAKLAPAGLSPTLITASAIITTAASLGFSRLALDLAAAFEQTSVRRLDGEVWVDVLVSCAESLYAEGTLRTWRKVVHELNFLPDEGCCIQVLHTAARHGLSELALDVIGVLKSINIVWCEHHIAPVIEAMCHHQELKDALLMFDFMRKNDIAFTLETAEPIFDIISKDTDAVDNAWGELEVIHEEGHAIDVVALNVIIKAAISLHDLQRAVGTYKASTKLDVKPDVDTFNLLLLGCVEARHRELGDKLLSEMKEEGIRPDVTTYERMVRLCLTQSMYEDAFFYLEEMKSLGMVPPRIVYEALIRKLVTVGDTRYKLAVEELKECGYEVTPRLKSYIDSGGAHEGPASQQAAASEPVLL
ncbi:hypothetical protein C8Q79DRAFT_965250 [Trametes meyenii]|nr:hypothetical protein C8Q79DRAFT_965250 [Trametes meyenii]